MDYTKAQGINQQHYCLKLKTILGINPKDEQYSRTVF